MGNLGLRSFSGTSLIPVVLLAFLLAVPATSSVAQTTGNQQDGAKKTPVKPAGNTASNAAGNTWAPLNQAVYALNTTFYVNVVDPLAMSYNSAVHPFVRGGFSNFFENLSQPMTAFSSVLQGDLDNAGAAAARFSINTTFGIGGSFDVATDVGVLSRPEDMGQYFCSIGWSEGPYVELPIIGGSSLRDVLGGATGVVMTMFVIGPLMPVYYVSNGLVGYFDADASKPNGTLSTDSYGALQQKRLDARAEACIAGKPDLPEPSIKETRMATDMPQAVQTDQWVKFWFSSPRPA
ncbi:MAG: hypothetical protein HOL85_17735 [Rhodospirillaceae bacterium]|jgi:ABC-type transporter lipoprotein component MlaA|nr:hypothetical protein [Rhodospirillaceae bacterium]MBT6137914.1 hypothetical protein [Rhodospirillaceae bacterium]